jgi:protein-arginine kinase activator protein McsA
MAKKIKSPLDKIKWEAVELPPDWYEKHLEEERKAEETARKAETDRIKKIKCPSCGSTSKDHVEHRDDNGIIGPGYSSWITNEYFVCRKCGTMFKDLEKYKGKKNVLPRGNR